MGPNKITIKKSKKGPTFEIETFKLDIDELIKAFVKNGSKTLVDMKRIWISKRFSFIYEARPTTNIACFMQSLYSHCIGYVVSDASLSPRLGGLYCLYCLHETQPYKPPFRIYISLGELRRLRKLVVDSRKENVKVPSALVNRMLEKNMFLFGAVDLKEGSVTEKIKELRAKEDATIRIAQKKLFEDSRIEHFIHMDLGMELDLDYLKKMSSDYEAAKKLAVKEAGDMVDIQNIKHLTEDQRLIGDVVEDTANQWSNVKGLFYQETQYDQRRVDSSKNGEPYNLRKQQPTVNSELEEPSGHSDNQGEGDNCQPEEDGFDDDLAMELEQALAQSEEDSEDDLAMDLEQDLSEYEGDSDD
ncbi:Small nuclear RNA activating complex (SNAPc), subunit SNAP43 [Heracleum sosnowskyi]|uniref:Small nuclear RNA activating complex (SNAPc), subunit SNAP43 n=1 Tax=Heracleum sosnowskyi TaxID=360622 RepID=A0AAD8N7V2_9APIA|nr:Small nuclear RNA activating complex (SNAPc), subunit SNAP43 [Heracleum sosnowskyi]